METATNKLNGTNKTEALNKAKTLTAEFNTAQITKLFNALGDFEQRIHVTQSPLINFWDWKGAQWGLFGDMKGDFFKYPFYSLQFKVVEGDYLAHGRAEIISGKNIKIKLSITDIKTQLKYEFSRRGYVTLTGSIKDNARQLHKCATNYAFKCFNKLNQPYKLAA